MPASGFELVVADVDRTARLYSEVLGFSFRSDTTSDRITPLLRAAGVPGRPVRETARTRSWNVGVNGTGRPGGGDRTASPTRFQDPGTPVLQLLVRDANAVTAAWKRAGGEIVTTGGAPVSVGALKLVVLRDPDNLMIELIEGR